MIQLHDKSRLCTFLVVLLCCKTTLALSEPRYVCGQRCLFVPASSTSPEYPPLVLVGGLGQTIGSYESHLPYLSCDRNVLVYECLGQGFPENNGDVYSNVTLPFQAERLLTTVNKIISGEFDFVGFSLGGRIGMAAATLGGDIRRLHLTGIASQRSLQGEVALEAWRNMIQEGNLQGFAWSALQTTYSAPFLQANKHRLSAWVQHLQHSNSAAGLHSLLVQAYPTSLKDPWQVSSMATHIPQKGRILVGECDLMIIDPEALASVLQWESPHVIPGCGHAVPMEQPRAWRKNVLEFLDQE